MTANLDHCIKRRMQEAHREVAYSVNPSCCHCKYFTSQLTCIFIIWGLE